MKNTCQNDGDMKQMKIANISATSLKLFTKAIPYKNTIPQECYGSVMRC